MGSRIYGAAWIVALALAGGLYLGSASNPLTLSVFAFAVSTLVVMGFVAMLPMILDGHFSSGPVTAPARGKKTF